MISHNLEDTEVHLLCAADDHYAPFAGIMMNSVLTTAENYRVHFHVLSDKIGIKNLIRLQSLTQSSNSKMTVYQVADKLIGIPKAASLANHLNRTAYARLFFSEFVPASVERILYLDCDIICTGSLLELWELGSAVHVIGAAQDPWLDLDSSLKFSLKIGAESSYVNSGVLLINVTRWREMMAQHSIAKFIEENPSVKHADQDAINAVFAGQIDLLDSKWNMMIDLPNSGGEQRGMASAALLHYVGGFKPWHLGYSIFRKSKFAPFGSSKRSSPWKWMLPQFHLRRLFKKVKRLILKNLPSALYRQK